MRYLIILKFNRNHPFAYYIQRGDFMDIIISIIMCFLSVYGVFQIIYNFALYLTKNNKTTPMFSHYLAVADDTSTEIEAYVRSLALKMDKNDKVIIITNCESPEIIEMLLLLEGEYDFIVLMSPEEYINYIDSSILKNNINVANNTCFLKFNVIE